MSNDDAFKRILDFGDKLGKMSADEDSPEMTDEDIDMLVEALEGELSESEKMLRDMPGNDASALEVMPEYLRKSIQESKDKLNGVPMQAEFHIDPVTGMRDVMMTGYAVGENEKGGLSLSELIEGKRVTEEHSMNLIEENLDDVMIGDQEVEIKDVQAVYNFMSDVESGKIKKNNLYMHLPQIMKNEIAKLEGQQGQILPLEQKNMLALEFYNSMSMSIQMDQELIDLNEAIEKEFDYDIMDMYLDNIVEVMETDMLSEADNLEEQGEKEKAQELRDISAAFTRAYTYETLRTFIKNKSGVINRDMNRDLRNFDKRCKRFSRLYISSQFIIPDIRIIVPILDRQLPDDIHIDDIKKFVLLMISEFLRMSPDNLEEHVEMYYAIKMIEALDYIDSKESDMRDIILGNIQTVIKEIKEN